MIAVGLTGGIGAGKSTVAKLLVARGAVLIDADQIAREVVAPGGPAYRPMIDRFGPTILGPDGLIDRQAVAAVVFADPGALGDLNTITHPAIGIAMMSRKNEHAATDAIVVLDIPLLTEAHRELLSLAAVIVVDVPTETALDRIITSRGISREEGQARVDAQIGREARLSLADLVVDNSADEEHLVEEVDRVWGALVGLAAQGSSADECNRTGQG